MVMLSTVTKANESVDCTGQRAVVAGATQGIGAGVALRFALAGASVWIVGRSEERANGVLEKLRMASAEAHRRKSASGKSQAQDDHTFFQADLSKTEEVQRVAGAIADKAGEGGVDWLVMTQGGPPTGVLKPKASPASPEGGFAVGVFSRFGLAYILTQRKVITKGICNVSAPAQGGKKPLDVDDLDLTKANARGDLFGGWLSIPTQGMIGSSVLDSVTQTLAERNPNLVVSHLFPGINGTDAVANQGFPSILAWGNKLATSLGLLYKPEPGSYPEVPFYLHANPEASSRVRKGEANLFGPTLKRYEPMSSNVQDPAVRTKVWKKLESYLEAAGS